MPQSDSCLIAKLSHYIELDERHEELLSNLEKSEQPVQAGEEVYTAGDPMKKLFVVKSGWLYGYTYLPDGGRHVVRIYHPGDMIGFPTLALRHHAMNLRVVTEGRLCPFEKADLDEIFETAPKITALLFTLAAREEVILIDTLRAASRMRPKARIAFLLMDLVSRLRITNDSMSNRFRLPLNQSEIGDTIGLTNVTVSRTLSAMEEEGLILRVENEIILLDEDELQEICDYQDRYSDMDTSWFPRQ